MLQSYTHQTLYLYETSQSLLNLVLMFRLRASIYDGRWHQKFFSVSWLCAPYFVYVNAVH